MNKIISLFVCFGILFSLVSCTKIGGGGNDEVYSVTVTFSRQLTDRGDMLAVASYLVENSKLEYPSAAFDYEGDESCFRYSLIAWGGKRSPADNLDFVSPYNCTAMISGYIILNNYECQCDDWIVNSGGCVIQDGGIPREERNPELCMVTYSVLLGKNEHFEGINDRSLITVVRAVYEDVDSTSYYHDVHYKVLYDGKEILYFSTCVPLDDTIISLFVDHLVIFSNPD